MKKIARYISIMMIAVLLTGCEEASATIQSTISDSAEVNQGESTASNVTSSVETDETVGNDEIETQVVENEVVKDNNQVSESSSADNKAGVSQENEPAAEELVVVEPTYEEIVSGEVAVDNIITFGRYEQDNNIDNGPEPIEWRVLEISDGKATLIPVMCLMWGISKDADDKTDEFYYLAFDEAEQKVLVDRPKLMTDEMIKKHLSVKTKTATGDWYYHNSIFLLQYTEYAIANGAKIMVTEYPGQAAQSYYRYWTQTDSYSYRFGKDDIANNISFESFDRTSERNYTNPYRLEGICPYIEIYTEKR